MGKYLGQWAPPIFWNFAPDKCKILEKNKNIKKKKMPSPLQFQRDMNHCWGLAHACQAVFTTLFSTLKGKRRFLDPTTK